MFPAFFRVKETKYKIDPDIWSAWIFKILAKVEYIHLTWYDLKTHGISINLTEYLL